MSVFPTECEFVCFQDVFLRDGEDHCLLMFPSSNGLVALWRQEFKFLLPFFFCCFVLMPKILNVFSIYEEEEIAQYRTLNGARL